MSTTAAGVPSHARKDREGPAKAGKVDCGSGARSPATTNPGEDNEVWPRPTRQEDASTAPGTRCDPPRQEDASTAPGADALQHRTAPGATRHPRPRSRCATSAAIRAQAGPSWARSGPGSRQSCVAALRPGGRLDEDTNRAREHREASTEDAQRTEIKPRRAQVRPGPARGLHALHRGRRHASTAVSSSSPQGRLRPPARRPASETAARLPRDTRSRRPLHRHWSA
jgi:hypothetical protein